MLHLLEKVKNIHIIAVVLFIAIGAASLFFGLYAIGEQASNTYAEGTLLKCSGGSGIYYVASNGKRYVFPNRETYDTWYESFSLIQHVSDEVCASIPLGGNVTIRPGSALVHFPSTVEVYAVAYPNVLRYVASEKVAEDLYGSGWSKKGEQGYLRVIGEALFNDYVIGDPIVEADAYRPETEKTACLSINECLGFGGLSDVGDISTSTQAQTPTTTPVVSSTEEQVQSNLFGFCWVKNATGYDSIRGVISNERDDGYVRKEMPGVETVTGLQTECTEEIYDELMDLYCLTNSQSVQRLVGVINKEQNTIESSCSSFGCAFYACGETQEDESNSETSTSTSQGEEEEETDSGSGAGASSGTPREAKGSSTDRTVVQGECLVRTGLTSTWVPTLDSPNSAPQYAKRNISGVSSHTALVSACTQSTYDELKQELCSLYGGSGVKFQQLAVSFNAQGDWAYFGCGGGTIGCNYVYCQ